ncbi:MAG: TAXI family TRAP transporter solute-binding subunit [Sulfurospirillum sp.]|nr:TAXI family TRAP transporter solute-binding subunit [Sulfurospirillum sp.]
MRCEWCKIAFIITASIAAILAFSYQFIDPAPPRTITIATGSTSGSYFSFANTYKKLLQKQRFELVIVPTAGSVEALQKLQNKEVDVAFIQGGTAQQSDKENLESLASIYFEPLWIFYNANLNFKYINELKGKKIAIGALGSGTRPLALDILHENHINENNSHLLELSGKNAKESLLNGEIDAFFTVISPHSPMIQELLINPNIKLLNIKRANAYSKRFQYLTPLHLSEGVVNLEKNIPTQNITLLSTTATLVIQKDLHPDLIRLLLKSAKEIHAKTSIFQESENFPSDKYLQIPINQDAQHYLQKGDSFLEKIFPFWIASTIDRFIIMIIPLLTLLFPIIKGALPLYRWRIRSKIYKWYKILHEIDLKLDCLNANELKSIQTDLEKMAHDIQHDSKIPLSYMGEYYDLRVHADLILARIEKKLVVV